MNITVSILPLLFFIVPAVAAFLIMATGDKYPNLRESWTIIAGFVNLALIIMTMPRVLNGELITTEHHSLVKNVDFILKIDTAGMVFAALASLLWVFTSFYSIGYMRAERKKTKVVILPLLQCVLQQRWEFHLQGTY